MENIVRPKEIPRSESSYLSNEKYQEYNNEQLNKVYNKLDEIVENINSQDEVILYENNAPRVIAGSLKESYKNFEEICIVVGNTYDDANSERIVQTIPTSYINRNFRFIFNFSFLEYDRRIFISLDSEKSYIKTFGPNDYVVRKIYGIHRKEN